MSRMLPRSVACLSRLFSPWKCSPVIVSSEGHGALSGLCGSRVLVSQFHSSQRCEGPENSPVNCDEPDFDPTEARSPPSAKILRLVDEIASLSLLEVSDVTTLLKKKLGMPNMPMGSFMGGGMIPQGGAPAAPVKEKEPEKTIFDVKLEKFDAAAKIKIIKEVRTFTSLGLKEAKELVEKVPAVLKKGVSKDEATQIIEKIKAVGGAAVME